MILFGNLLIAYGIKVDHQMNRNLTLKQAVKQGKFDGFIAQYHHNPVSRDLQKQFEWVLDSMVKGKPTDGETYPLPNSED